MYDCSLRMYTYLERKLFFIIQIRDNTSSILIDPVGDVAQH